jgi:hypothetical protein
VGATNIRRGGARTIGEEPFGGLALSVRMNELCVAFD